MKVKLRKPIEDEKIVVTYKDIQHQSHVMTLDLNAVYKVAGIHTVDGFGFESEIILKRDYQYIYIRAHRGEPFELFDELFDVVESEDWSVSQKEAIRKQLQHYHHMMRHSVEAYKLEERVATHYENDCIRKIEAITKGSETK